MTASAETAARRLKTTILARAGSVLYSPSHRGAAPDRTGRPGRWVFAACLLLAGPAFALDPNRQPNTYLVQGWTTEQGLPSDLVRAVTQTRDGYLWVATALGVARFDGNRFTVFSGKTRPELLGANFFAAVEAPDGTLWFGASTGLFRRRGGDFERFTTEHGLPHNYVRMLALARDGSLVVGTRGGLAFVRDGRIATRGGPWLGIEGVARAYVERADGAIVIGTEQHLYKISGDTLERLSDEPALSGDNFMSALEAPKGSLWIGQRHGLRHVGSDGLTEKFALAQGVDDARISSLRLDRDGNLWIGKYGSLYRMALGQIEPASYPDQFDAATIHQIYEDREGQLWLATTSGLFCLRNRVCDTIGGAGSGVVRADVYPVCETRAGDWLLGMWNGGVYRQAQGTTTLLVEREKLKGSQMRALAEEPEGTIWIGAAGLFRYKDGEIAEIYSERLAPEWRARLVEKPESVLPGIAHERVNSIASDGLGKVWVATEGALYHGREGEFRAYTTAGDLPGKNFRALLRARDGAIWVTVPPEGVACLRAGRWTSYRASATMPGAEPRGVFEDRDGAIWITTNGHGVARLKNGRWRTFGETEGLETDSITSVVDDETDALWLGTSRGVMRIPWEQFGQLEAGERPRLTPHIFTRSDGLPPGGLHGLGWPSALRARDGRLLFATHRGAAVIDPRAAAVSEARPPVYIERVEVNGAPANIGAITVPPGANEVRIRYAAISLAAPERIRFKTRLEPLDTGWVEATTTSRDARWASLPPGGYRFRVIACNANDVWNEKGAAIAFTVLPHFYQTGWFAALTVGIVIAAGLGTYGVRVRSARRQMALLQQRVDERTRELQSALAALKVSQRKLLDLAHQAGMAEVATGILHNVGNVLNSVNVSTTVLAERVRDSKGNSVSRLAHLLAEQPDLGGFFAADPRAQKVLPFLQTTAEHLAQERKHLLDEIAALQKNVEHIKEIVAMQKSHARMGGVTEPLDIGELVDEAVCLNSATLDHNDVSVVRDFQARPVLSLQKHKALQVLVNLIRNAKQACDEAGRTDKQITVRITEEDQRVQIAVIDNGVGIPPENLIRIFAHGFTTRPGGHGFGLHNAANAATELGGRLTAQSEGVGKGATFTLELPARGDAQSGSGAEVRPGS